MEQQKPKKKKTPMNPVAKAQRLDVAIGILGFFTFAAFVTAVIAEVRGDTALREALVLLALSVTLWLAIRARRNMRL